MIHKFLITAATAAILTSPAFAQAGGYGNAQPARPMQPTTNTTPTSTQPVTPVQGPANASPTGASNASPNSAAARAAGNTLATIKPGMAVQNRMGSEVGSVSNVILGSDGSVTGVVVTGHNGRNYRLAPSAVSISGDVVTTTSNSIPE